jgi:hypothetical protein
MPFAARSIDGRQLPPGDGEDPRRHAPRDRGERAPAVGDDGGEADGLPARLRARRGKGAAAGPPLHRNASRVSRYNSMF